MLRAAAVCCVAFGAGGQRLHADQVILALRLESIAQAMPVGYHRSRYPLLLDLASAWGRRTGLGLDSDVHLLIGSGMVITLPGTKIPVIRVEGIAADLPGELA